MGFSIKSLMSRENTQGISKSDIKALLGDGALVILTSTVSVVAVGIILSGAGPSGVRGVGILFATFGISSSVLVVVVDSANLYVRIKNKKDPVKSEEIPVVEPHNDEIPVVEPYQEEKLPLKVTAEMLEIKKAAIMRELNRKKVAVNSEGPPIHKPYNCILRNLYLGSRFLPLTIYEKEENQDNFRTIISCCQFQEIYTNANLKLVDNCYSELGIEWLILGSNFGDVQPYDTVEDDWNWGAFVYDCTHPEKVREKFEECTCERESTSKAKLDEIKKLDASEWFKATFEKMDEAVFGENKTYIHCFAGMSRSVSLVAAYMINRFGLSAEQALAYIGRKRNIQCFFLMHLINYELLFKASLEKSSQETAV